MLPLSSFLKIILLNLLYRFLYSCILKLGGGYCAYCTHEDKADEKAGDTAWEGHGERFIRTSTNGTPHVHTSL